MGWHNIISSRPGGTETATLKLFGNPDTGQIEKQKRQIDVEHDVVIDGTGLHFLRVAQNKGYTQRFFIHEAFVVSAVIPQKEALR
ncbi:hypothetical protein CSA56_16015 [candidate division KSB3 bacterium]|uniref:Uncharacterized protein n=1 Tax=candidate division KSB3 bacterium TaxID=2044937 RepID=A0A2G6K976_9BACT|nr:MAG: hypothetical protein CSA56_16015 [candidate division KSB3 bacterium]